MVLVGYAVLLVLMLAIRPGIAEVVAGKTKVEDPGTIYAGLYILPTLTVIHALFAGIICKL